MPDNNVSAVVLAAGNSSRLSSWKPGILLIDHSILYYSLKTLSSITDDIIVVGGCNFHQLELLVSTISRELNIPVKCIFNLFYESGMFSSVKAGLRHAERANIFITLADMPFIKEETYSKMLEINLDVDIVYPVQLLESGIKKGHPILINESVKQRILNTKEDIILRDVLKEFRSTTCFVDDEGINFDIDNEKDLIKAKSFITLHEKNQDILL